MSQGDTKTGHTINDIVSDLISEVDDGTLVNKHTQASQLHDVTAVNHDEEVRDYNELVCHGLSCVSEGAYSPTKRNH